MPTLKELRAMSPDELEAFRNSLKVQVGELNKAFHKAGKVIEEKRQKDMADKEG